MWVSKDLRHITLKINIDEMTNLKCLREEILNQLEKNVVKFDLTFDVGFFFRIPTKNSNTKTELCQLKSKSKALWCEGKPGKKDARS